jgi:hypothetical protein
MQPPTASRHRAAWIIALVVDAIQIGLISTTGPFSFLIDIPLDLVAMAILWRLLGWHWVLLPTFVIEFLPIAELAPSWTLAVWIITRRQQGLSVENRS